jgi:RNA polymerase sigma factor (sigma-70 family)
MKLGQAGWEIEMAESPNASANPSMGSGFATTHWSVVMAAGKGHSTQASEALEQLCRTYWYPLYAFVRRHVSEAHDAEDLTQEFFTRFLAKEYFGRADPALGRFRSFLLACLKNFLAEQRRQARRLKRGGGRTTISWDSQTAEERYRLEPADPVTPEQVYDRRWALTLLETALGRLTEEQSTAGKEEVFTQLKDCLWGEGRETGYAAMAARLGLTEGAVKVAVHRLRRRFRDLLREEVAHTVAADAEVDEELRHLIGVIRR